MVDWEGCVDQHIDKLELMKVEANALFSQNEHKLASKMYYNILCKVVKVDSTEIDVECLKNEVKRCVKNVTHPELKKFLSTVTSNMALCYKRMGKKEDAKTLLEASIIFDENNYKANYNLANSYLLSKDYNMSLYYIDVCQKVVKMNIGEWKNKNQPHLDLMEQIRQLLRRNDINKDTFNQPRQLVDEVRKEVNVTLNLQRLQLVPSRKLLKSEAVVELLAFCNKRLKDELVDEVLVAVWSSLYQMLYKCDDDCKYELYSQFLSSFNNKECSLYNYVKMCIDMYSKDSKSEIMSIVTSVAKCCPLVKGVDGLEVLLLLLEDDYLDKDIVLSSILMYFSKTGKVLVSEKNSKFNTVLSKMTQKLVGMCDEECVSTKDNLEACLMAIFRMKFEGYEVTQDSFISMVNMALEPFVYTEVDPVTGKGQLSFEHNWYVAAKCLFLANKTTFKAHMVINNLVHHLVRVYVTVYSEQLRRLSFELLLNCVDFVEFRQEILDYVQDNKSFIELLYSPELVKCVNELDSMATLDVNQKKIGDRVGADQNKLHDKVDEKVCSIPTDSVSGINISMVGDNTDRTVCQEGTGVAARGKGRDELNIWFVESRLLMYSKLSLHSSEVKNEILGCVNLFKVLPKMLLQVIKRNADEEMALQSVSFASLHEEFKHADLTFIPVLVEKYGRSDCSTLMVVQTISNLLRGNKDRNSFIEDMDMLKYDSEQIKQLKILQERLPAEAKLNTNGNYFEGNDESANKARSIIFRIGDHAVPKYLARTFKTVCSESAKALMVESLHYLALNVDHRRYLQSLGVIRIFINVANSTKYQPTQNNMALSYRRMNRYKLVVQSIAHLCIATDPANLIFSDAQDAIQPLMNLLEDDNELYQYESALALTNLLSTNDDIRKRVFSLKGWDRLSNLLFSDNDMLKTAALEGWCNLCGGDDVVHGHFYLMIKTQIDNTPEGRVYEVNVHDINIMLMFVAHNIKHNTLSAASGALALLVRDSRIAQYMPFVSRFENVLKTLDAIDDPSIIHRLLTILSCVVQSKLRDMDEVNEAHVKSVFQSIRDTVKLNSHKYKNKILLDLFNEIC